MLSSRDALAFDLTVMRGHDEFKRVQFSTRLQQLASKDELGLNRILYALQANYLET